jgi:hypothetical protein
MAYELTEDGLRRINEAHTAMALPTCEQGADHELAGFKHRVYKQHDDEGCYICALLADNLRLRAELGAMARERAEAVKVELRELARMADPREHPQNALCATCGRTWGQHTGRCCDLTGDRRFVEANSAAALGVQPTAAPRQDWGDGGEYDGPEDRPNDPHDDLTPGADATDRAGVAPPSTASDGAVTGNGTPR